MGEKRSELHQQVVETLLDSKALNLEAIGSVISQYGDKAARDGESLVSIINLKLLWCCGWPGPEIDVFRHQAPQQFGV